MIRDEAAAEAVPDHEVVIAPDDEPATSDDASDRAPSFASSSTSIAASVLDYRQENGRTYHAYKDGKYVIPNDERENDRLDLQHNLFLMTFDGRLGNAPPNDKDAKVGRVLDVGTGTGIWAIDFGDEHPESEVLGFDLSAAFPDFVPPNVKFEVDDLEESWTYSRPFDYIHSRMMNGCVIDWDAYTKKCFDNLTPGGYAEFTEATIVAKSDDGTLKEDAMIVKTAKLVLEAGAQTGRTVMEAPRVKEALIKAGFEDIRVSYYKWPTNTWPKDKKYKEIGVWAHENITSGWEGLCLASLTRMHGWTPEEVTIAMMQCRKEFKDRHIHAYFPLFSIVARKPSN